MWLAVSFFSAINESLLKIKNARAQDTHLVMLTNELQRDLLALENEFYRQQTLLKAALVKLAKQKDDQTQRELANRKTPLSLRNSLLLTKKLN